MQPERRPSSDEILARIQEKERREKRGKLKIFLGYAAGVGKTYAMLLAAQAAKKEGIDVIVAVIDTHGRRETEILLEGLDILPMKDISYKGAVLQEMDIDSVLKRKPGLAIVDELAHTNAPGSRHPKRYQDVEELLAAGIDVYSTLNIQHLESLHDAIAQITGITVRERLPDDVIDKADEIVLIDLPPEELLKRLKEGKVYAPAQASRALQRFFKSENLTALREITLRSATDRVSQEMREKIEDYGITGPWPSGERILTCISPHENNEKLIRASRRLAKSLKAEWYTIFVETNQTLSIPREDRDRVALNLKLAESLGSKTVTVPGDDVSGEILRYATSHNITKITIGNPKIQPWWNFFTKSPADELIRKCTNIDVYVINPGGEKEEISYGIQPSPTKTRGWLSYMYCALLIIGVTLIGIPISWYFAPINIGMLYLGAVIISAIYFGQWPSLFTAFVGVICLEFFFIEKKLSFRLEDTQYLITLAGMLLIGVIISRLASNQRLQIENAQRRQREVVGLYELSRDLASAHNPEAVCRTVIDYVQQIYQADAAILIAEGQLLDVFMHTPNFKLDENELAVANWSLKNNKAAGWSTDTLPAAAAYHQPLQTAENPIGILTIKPPDRNIVPTPDDLRLLEGIAHLAATNLERAFLAAPKRPRRK